MYRCVCVRCTQSKLSEEEIDSFEHVCTQKPLFLTKKLSARRAKEVQSTNQ
jgi:hypothetical protein